jgi:hypothetical protein
VNQQSPCAGVHELYAGTAVGEQVNCDLPHGFGGVEISISISLRRGNLGCCAAAAIDCFVRRNDSAAQ